jgi:hypothetical protein
MQEINLIMDMVRLSTEGIKPHSLRLGLVRTVGILCLELTWSKSYFFIKKIRKTHPHKKNRSNFSLNF